MVTVHIWNFRGTKQAWGHASLELDRTYISWWPENPGQVPTKIPNVYASHPFRNRNFAVCSLIAAVLGMALLPRLITWCARFLRT